MSTRGLREAKSLVAHLRPHTQRADELVCEPEAREAALSVLPPDLLSPNL